MSKQMQRDHIEIRIFPDARAASMTAAEMFATAIAANPELVLGLATGGTPIEAYQELIRRHRDEGLDFSAVTTFNLDEYVGLAPNHPQSYRRFMQQHLFDHVNVDAERTHVPDGLADDLSWHVLDYEEQIRRAGGIDLQLLGIGHNGHIAFNEPGSPRDCRTRVVNLSEQTIEKNSRFFDTIEEVPRQAVTMGIGTIMESQRIVMLALGAGKADAVRLAVEGAPCEQVPASWLQEHQDVTFLLDEAAASGLRSH